jgi:predicted TIM-barrel enzyme
VKRAVPSHPVWLGSGVRVETAARWSALADGVIVGSALREGGRAGGPIDAARALAFAKAWRGEEAAR